MIDFGLQPTERTSPVGIPTKQEDNIKGLSLPAAALLRMLAVHYPDRQAFPQSVMISAIQNQYHNSHRVHADRVEIRKALLELVKYSMVEAELVRETAGLKVYTYRGMSRRGREACKATVVQAPTCREDGRCQYAIDNSAESEGYCPKGECYYKKFSPPSDIVLRSACPDCKGTGMRDSGGVTPWDEPISIRCDCDAPPSPKETS